MTGGWTAQVYRSYLGRAHTKNPQAYPSLCNFRLMVSTDQSTIRCGEVVLMFGWFRPSEIEKARDEGNDDIEVRREGDWSFQDIVLDFE